MHGPVHIKDRCLCVLLLIVWNDVKHGRRLTLNVTLTRVWGKAVIITYSECVAVALDIQQALRTFHMISQTTLIRKKGLLNIKCVL